MRSAFTAASVITFVAAILVFSMISNIMTAHNVSAQNTRDNKTVTTMTSSSQNITSSVKIIPTLISALVSQVKVSLVQATMAAEKAVGNSSHAIVALLKTESGYLVYTVWVLDGSDDIHQVIVDPGNGQVLAQKKSMMAPTILDPSSLAMGIMNPLVE